MELTCINEREVYLDGKQLALAESLKLRNHSPSGFSWGYGGSGPAQLALAVCLETFKGTAWEDHSFDWYQQFKRDVISVLPQKPCVAEIDFWGWFHRDHGNQKFRFEVRELAIEEKGQNGKVGANLPCSRGWAERCASSRGKHCTCQCGGQNHGKALHHD